MHFLGRGVDCRQFSISRTLPRVAQAIFVDCFLMIWELMRRDALAVGKKWGHQISETLLALGVESHDLTFGIKSFMLSVKSVLCSTSKLFSFGCVREIWCIWRHTTLMMFASSLWVLLGCTWSHHSQDFAFFSGRCPNLISHSLLSFLNLQVKLNRQRLDQSFGNLTRCGKFRIKMGFQKTPPRSTLKAWKRNWPSKERWCIPSPGGVVTLVGRWHGFEF